MSKVLTSDKETETSLTSTIIPQKVIKTKDKVSNSIIDDFMNCGEQALKMENSNKKSKPITTKVTFSYEGVDIQARQEFTAFDREVHDSIVSLYIAGNEIITPSMVFRTMTGKTETEYVHSAKINEIIKSIDKCLFSRISIDATEEMIYYGFQNALFSGYLINANKISCILKGQNINAYKLMDIPILYRYASQKNQITTIPIKLLDTPLSKTNDIIVLQGYLIRRIESMRSPKAKTTNVILYETLYKSCKVENAGKQKHERIRKNVKTILDYWITFKYISSYKETEKGKAKYSLIIDL